MSPAEPNKIPLDTKLIIFVKAPRLGNVKTRLAESIGDHAACAAYQTLVTRLVENLDRLPGVELRFSPDDAAEEIRPWLRHDWQLSPQGPGDLGAKLNRAIQESFAAGAKRVVVIGSDCPAIVAADIEMAWATLATHDVVLGPATDGGYWLIGLRQPQPNFFQNIPWSTERVFETTLARAREAKLSIHRLRTLSDVDLIEDWEDFLSVNDSKPHRREEAQS